MKFYAYQLIILSLLLCTKISAQASVDHWESLVISNNLWKYFEGTSEPPFNWINVDFNDETWTSGKGGFGFGDNDDSTNISAKSSVYLRIKFDITDPSQIKEIVFLADYDDAFVAYLNGKEFSRSGMSGNRPSFDQLADSQHEASLYRGLYPDEIIFTKSKIIKYLIPDENILAIQVHNIKTTSSDLSSNFFLNVGLNVSSTTYQNVPDWFQPPITFNSSYLPIVKINTEGKVIPDEPKINAKMKIINNGEESVNHIDDTINGYNGNVGIELRGSSSQSFPKKQFAVELWTASGADTSASILGLPVEEDWILYAPYSDKSLIRNVLTYKLGEKLGRYAPRTKLCELFLNNKYQGVYVLTEKIKRDKNRVDISKLTQEENSGDDLTGGYIVKIDKFTGSKLGLNWESPYTPPNQDPDQKIRFQYHYPKEEVITIDQRKYIQDYITQFEHILAGPKFRDLEIGYRKYINTESFIDFAILNELTRNVDGYRLSTFLYKDKESKGGKLTIGPIWDYNLAFGNADYCKGGDTDGWAWDFNSICNHPQSIPFWWQRFLRDPNYIIQFQNRWIELRKNILSNAKINFYIDSLTMILDEPQKRNFTKFPILDEYIWPNNFVGNTYANEINYLKNWINDRLTWLDSNIAALEIVTNLEDDLLLKKNITIYPNPNDGDFIIHFEKQINSELDFNLYNNLGELVYNKKLFPNQDLDFYFSLEKFIKGVYFANISNNDKLVYSEKIILK